jgi:single-strand DNA-binding protein
MYNKVTLLGFVTKDAELRYLPTGTAVCNVTVATNHSYKKDNEWKKETLFMNCAIFGTFAEHISQYLLKGVPVFAEGRLQEQKWESDGQAKSKIVAILDVIKTLDKKEAKEEAKEPKKEKKEKVAREPIDDLEPF